jgi:hypothetical protein
MEPLTISLFLTPCILRGLITSTISDGSMIGVSEVQTRWMFVVPTILTTLRKRVMHMGYNEAFVLLISIRSAFSPHARLSDRLNYTSKAYCIGVTFRSVLKSSGDESI